MGSGNITIYWTERAINDLNRIHSFNIELKGKAKADQLIIELKSLVQDRLRNPIDGSMPDPQFLHLSGGIRKILTGYHKVSFLSGKETKIILRVFDMRQDPIKNL